MALVAYSKNSSSNLRMTDSTIYKDRFGVTTGETISSIDMSLPRNLSGYKNSSWRDQVAAGSNATTPLAASEVTVADYVPASAEYKYASVYTGYQKTGAIIYGLPSLDSTLLTACANNCRSKAYKQFGSQFQGLTLLGELRQTIQGIRNPALGLRRAVNQLIKNNTAIRQGRRASHKEYRQAIGESWLEWSFGIKPLIGDLEDGLEAFRSMVDVDRFEPFKVSYSESKNSPRVYSGLNVGTGYMDIKLYSTDHHEASCVYQGSVRSAVNSSSKIQHFGLFPSEFIPTAWELVPWSFLIDYFTNIGDVLGAWATAQYVSFGYVSETSRNVVVRSIDCTPTAKSTPLRRVVSGSAKVSVKTVSRTSLSSVPLPTFSTNVKFSVPRALNIAALASGMIKDKRYSPK